MANYYCTARTSYFRVTDEEKFKDIMNTVSAEETWNDVSTNPKTGEQEIYHGFGSYESIDFYIPLSANEPEIKSILDAGGKVYDANGKEVKKEDIPKEKELFDENGNIIISVWDNDGFDDFLKKIQSIIHPEDAFVLLEVGHEKLRYITGYACIVTRKEIRQINLDSYINENLKEMLGEELSKKVKYTY